MKKEFKILGMHCDSCKSLIENELKDKVNKVKVDLSVKTVTVDFDEKKISEKEIIKSIEGLGYNAV